MLSKKVKTLVVKKKLFVAFGHNLRLFTDRASHVMTCKILNFAASLSIKNSLSRKINTKAENTKNVPQLTHKTFFTIRFSEPC